MLVASLPSSCEAIFQVPPSTFFGPLNSLFLHNGQNKVNVFSCVFIVHPAMSKDCLHQKIDQVSSKTSGIKKNRLRGYNNKD